MERLADDNEYGAPPSHPAPPVQRAEGATEQRRWYHLVRPRPARPSRKSVPSEVASSPLEEERAPRAARRRGTNGYAEQGRDAPAARGSASQVSADESVVLYLVVRGADGERVLSALRRQGVTGPILIERADDSRPGGGRAARSFVRRGARGAGDVFRVPPHAGAGVHELLTGPEIRPDARPLPAFFGDVVVDPDARTVVRRGVPVALTALEFDLLVALLRRRGRVASRQELLREVWGKPEGAAYTGRTVDAHVYKLRRKLESDPAVPRHILTIQKAGYRLQG